MTGRVLLSESGCVSQLHTPAIEALVLPQLDAAPMRRVTAEVSERAVIARQPHALARQPCVSTTTALGLQFAVLLVDILVTWRKEAGWRNGETSPDVAASGKRR